MFVVRKKEGVISLYLALVRPHLDTVSKYMKRGRE